MKKEYDFSKGKKRSKKVDPEAVKVAVSLRLDSSDLSKVRDEADRMGIPYQTLIGSIIHRYVNGELMDKREVDLLMIG